MIIKEEPLHSGTHCTAVKGTLPDFILLQNNDQTLDVYIRMLLR